MCHSLIILALNKVYHSVAIRLTTLENHKWKHEHEASLVYKRFLFEFFDFNMNGYLEETDLHFMALTVISGSVRVF